MYALLIACALVPKSFVADDISALRWRCIGPHRGGRTVGAVGIPGHPNEFLIGVNNGGVWKTSDYGRTWKPIFDDQPTGSVGAIAVAPSNSNVIYVGSGEGLQRPDLSVGNGVYRSADGGKTWRNTGLKDGLQISGMAVDPRDANVAYAAVLGHPYGPNAERGIFKTTDGGGKWTKALGPDENTGASQVILDPKDPNTVYGVLFASRQGPWENGQWYGKTSGLFKSTDAGKSWKRLGGGLPTPEQGLGRIGVCVSASNPKRLYAVVDCPTVGGVYRSDDAGVTWQKTSGENRLWGRGFDFAEIQCDPKNPNTVYVANTSVYRSTDGGKDFTAWRGAPGGDDFHTIWIHPTDPRIILLAADQGAIITVNGGETWSSWYNQPTAQFYHVVTDNSFPYRVYGGQQESGSAGVLSRGPYGQITFREWYPVGGDEYAYYAPDPLDPDIVYGGKVTRFRHSTREVENVAPPELRQYRALRTAPLIFAHADPKTLFFATNVLFKTSDEAKTWQIISPDLSREHPAVPENIGVFRSDEMKTMARRGVIYAVGPSYIDPNIIWAGTDDGLVHVTRDGGKTWTNVTPPELTAWSKVSQIDAGHFDKNVAYIAVNRIRLDDLKPAIYKTADGGKNWTKIVEGLPDEPVNTVREDPVRPGLLYCGTECAVYCSLNDGRNWASLRTNMPATSIRDLVVHGADLVVGTHGRSFWILDDISPLRQVKLDIHEPTLFQPEPSIRVAWNLNTDTPLPPEEPAGENPPDGAILYYYLPEKPRGPVVVEILDSTGAVIRKYSSDDKPTLPDEKSLVVTMSWARRPQVATTLVGLNRIVWDQHATGGGTARRGGLGMDAIEGDTPIQPRGKWMEPGEYMVRLTVNGKSQQQKLALKPDPRKAGG